MMLDAQRTFDELIVRTAGVHAERILKNRIYRIMVDQFAGTQEYMSLERLYDLYERGGYDLIVLDTPPSKNTLDFFDAPRKTAGLFDEQVMRWFVPNSGSESGFFQKLFNPGAAVLKLLSTIGGDKFVAELGEFFEALRVVRAEFKVRGDRFTRSSAMGAPTMWWWRRPIRVAWTRPATSGIGLPARGCRSG